MATTPEPAKPKKQRSDQHQGAALAIKLTTIDARIATAKQTITDAENTKAALLSNAPEAVRKIAEAIRGASNPPPAAGKGEVGKGKGADGG